MPFGIASTPSGPGNLIPSSNIVFNSARNGVHTNLAQKSSNTIGFYLYEHGSYKHIVKTNGIR